jgi:hypothetical protein
MPSASFLSLMLAEVLSLDDNNEFMVQVVFWAGGSPVPLGTNIQPHKKELFIFWPTGTIL